MSGTPIIRLIEKWFAEHGDEGEFMRHSIAAAYLTVPPAERDARVIFSTKPASLIAAVGEWQGAEACGLIGRYGLPSTADAQWLADVAGQHAILFLGDCDPADLMVFAWLRAQLPSERITFFGVSDEVLRLLAIEINDSLCIPCSESEHMAVPFLDQVFPDFRELVGTECARRLDGGRKIELEAVVSAAGGASLLRAITSWGR
jgi:hypothetical protein